MKVVQQNTETVDVKRLECRPRNPNEGDIQAIAESIPRRMKSSRGESSLQSGDATDEGDVRECLGKAEPDMWPLYLNDANQ